MPKPSPGGDPVERRGSLTIVGTGYLVAGHTTLEARARIEAAEHLFYLVAEPASERWIRSLNPAAESLAGLYGEGKPRKRTYAEMVERIVAPLAEGARVCAAFYGHPGIFVGPSHEAIRRARREGHEARMLPAVSAEDCLFADLGVDPSSDGCQSFEATDFLVRRRRPDPASAVVLWQIGVIGVRDARRERLWSPGGLRILAETLGESYPPDHEVVVYEAAAIPTFAPRIQRTTLARLPDARVTADSTLFVPPAERLEADPEMRRRLREAADGVDSQA